jgi:hypothetical protein
MARSMGVVGGAACLLLSLALGNAALKVVSEGGEYIQTIGWLNLRLDGLGLYFALLVLITLGLAGLMGGRGAIWQLLALAISYLLVRSYALGEWPLVVRLIAELGAAALIVVGVNIAAPRILQWGRSVGGCASGRERGYGGVMLVAWGMVGLALCSAEPSAVAGGMILAASAAWLGVAISGETGRDRSSAYKVQSSHSTFYILHFTFALVGLWLYLHAAMGRGELLYAALMIGGVGGIGGGLLRLQPVGGWRGGLLAGINLLGFAAGSIIVDLLLRPALAGLAGLPAWSSLKLTRLDLPAPQPNAAVGIGLQMGSDSSLLPLLALTLALFFALALAWLLYRALRVIRLWLTSLIC